MNNFVAISRAQTNRWRHRVAMCELVGETGSVACAASTLRNLTAAPTTRPSVIALYHIEKARVTLAHFYHGPSLTSQMARPFACRVAAPRWRRPCAAPGSATIRDGCRAATATSFLTASSSTTWTSSRGLTHTCRARRSAESSTFGIGTGSRQPPTAGMSCLSRSSSSTHTTPTGGPDAVTLAQSVSPVYC